MNPLDMRFGTDSSRVVEGCLVVQIGIHLSDRVNGLLRSPSVSLHSGLFPF